MMYNENLKNDYIANANYVAANTYKFAIGIFNNISSYEEKLGKDLSCFTTNEIITYYKMLNTYSSSYLSSVNSHFSCYTQWCLQQNIVPDSQNHYLEISREILSGCINRSLAKKRIITREDLLKMIDQLPNVSDAFLFLAIFEGINGKNFCEIRELSPKDFEGNTVRLCTDREIQVSDLLVRLAKESAMTDEYFPVVIGGGSGRKNTMLQENGKVIRDYANSEDSTDDFQKGRRIYRRLLRNCKYLGVDKWMNSYALTLSGQIAFVKQRANHYGMTLDEYMNSEHVTELSKQYDLTIDSRTTAIKNIKEYLA